MQALSKQAWVIYLAISGDDFPIAGSVSHHEALHFPPATPERKFGFRRSIFFGGASEELVG